MRIDADLAVAGSGFAGSLVALIARRLGLSVALLERGSHPRFAIGESSSPLANLLLESLCDRYGLDRVRPLAKWGTWRRERPEIACGLKRGFTFYAHTPGLPFLGDPDRRDQLLVAASPRDEIADTHWYRPEFDRFLAEEARAAGAQYVDRLRIDRLELAPATARLSGDRAGEPVDVRARLLVDATGPRGLVARLLPLAGSAFDGLPPTRALFSHFSGVRRLENAWSGGSEPPPYPPDDAAMHHVFPGGWIWVLRFSNGIVSAGVAATEALAESLSLEQGEAAWGRLLERLPGVREQFAGADAIVPFVHQPRLSWRSSSAAGEGWTMLPSAAAFVDPLLSTGFPLTLAGIERLARRLERDWNTPRLPPGLAADARLALSEADRTARLVGALYAAMDDFPLFAALARLYFAAASFSEAARRLGRPDLAGSFLCGDHPTFRRALEECCGSILAASAGQRQDPAWRAGCLQAIDRAIEPIDVAGLRHPGRRNWYPVEAGDLVAGAQKLHASASDIERLLERSGFLAAGGPGPRAAAAGR
jgi:FADH2 O2-dependent halogenase